MLITINKIQFRKERNKSYLLNIYEKNILLIKFKYYINCKI